MGLVALSVCPECGGDIAFDAVGRTYACHNCGLSARSHELAGLRRRINESMKQPKDEARERQERQSDYLDWWLSSNKRKP